MVNSDTLHDEEDKEQTSLIKQEQSWTRMEKILLVFGVLMNLGDGVEIYLPGVVTQQVSCDIGLSRLKESILNCILYFTLALGTAISGALADRFGRRELMLFSLYLSTVSTVVCATVPNYNTLLISRAFIGFCAGLNFSIHAVMIAELSTNKARLEKTMLIGSNMYSVGGLWAGVLGYLLLDVLGWRTFILLTSLPFFIPPIFMLHFCIEGKEAPQGHEEKDQVVQKEEVTVPNFVARTAKLGTYHAIHGVLGWMTILLVPALIQLFKIEESELAADCTVSATQGAELLLLSTVTFAVIPGKIFSHYTRGKISFHKMQVVVALLNAGVFAIMLTQRNIVAAVVTNFFVKFLYGVANMAFWNIYTDVNYFGTVRFALGASITTAMGLAGAVVGTAMVAFAPILAAMSTALVLSFLQILVVLSMTEVEQIPS